MAGHNKQLLRLILSVLDVLFNMTILANCYNIKRISEVVAVWMVVFFRLIWAGMTFFCRRVRKVSIPYSRTDFPSNAMFVIVFMITAFIVFSAQFLAVLAVQIFLIAILILLPILCFSSTNGLFVPFSIGRLMDSIMAFFTCRHMSICHGGSFVKLTEWLRLATSGTLFHLNPQKENAQAVLTRDVSPNSLSVHLLSWFASENWLNIRMI